MPPPGRSISSPIYKTSRYDSGTFAVRQIKAKADFKAETLLSKTILTLRTVGSVRYDLPLTEKRNITQ